MNQGLAANVYLKTAFAPLLVVNNNCRC